MPLKANYWLKWQICLADDACFTRILEDRAENLLMYCTAFDRSPRDLVEFDESGAQLSPLTVVRGCIRDFVSVALFIEVPAVLLDV